MRRIAGGLELALKIVPGASRSGFAGPLGNRLKVRVAAPPERGRANAALVALLREWLGVQDVTIVAGRSGREKTARVAGLGGLTEEQVAQALGDWVRS